MSQDEKPPEDSVSDSLQSSPSETQADSFDATENPGSAEGPPPITATAVDAEPQLVPSAETVDAEYAEAVLAEGENQSRPASSLSAALMAIPAPPLARNMENMSANGGAVGALVLGVWCLAGSLITNWSIINGLIGLLMGLWGLTSRKRKTALIGICLCLVGIFLSLVQANEIINTFLNAVDETEPLN